VEIAADLRYLDPQHLAVAGTRCEGLTVRNETGILGQFQGFLVDPVARRLRFVVIELLGRLRLMPVTTARIDLDKGAIELLDHADIRFSKPFQRDMFRTLSDESSIFGKRSTV
jgi:hypothetical protein